MKIQRLMPLAKGWVVLALLGGFLLMYLKIVPQVVSRLQAYAVTEGKPPDMRIWMSPQAMHGLWDRYGEEGRHFYARSAFTMDLAFPLIYGFFFSLLLLWIAKKARFQDSGLVQAAWIPLLAMAFDLAENTLHARMALSFPDYPHLFPLFCNVLGVVKFGGIGASLLLLLLFGVKWIGKKNRDLGENLG